MSSSRSKGIHAFHVFLELSDLMFRISHTATGQQNIRGLANFPMSLKLYWLNELYISVKYETFCCR